MVEAVGPQNALPEVDEAIWTEEQQDGESDRESGHGNPPDEGQTRFEKHKVEAESIHLLFHHVPKNPRCRTCQLAEAQRPSARRVKDYRLHLHL